MAFISVYGLQGRHLLDAFLWALDGKHILERPDVTLALAYHWSIRVRRHDQRPQTFRIDRDPLSKLDDQDVARWIKSIRELNPQCPQDYMGLSPLAE